MQPNETAIFWQDQFSLVIGNRCRTRPVFTALRVIGILSNSGPDGSRTRRADLERVDRPQRHAGPSVARSEHARSMGADRAKRSHCDTHDHSDVRRLSHPAERRRTWLFADCFAGPAASCRSRYRAGRADLMRVGWAPAAPAVSSVIATCTARARSTETNLIGISFAEDGCAVRPRTVPSPTFVAPHRRLVRLASPRRARRGLVACGQKEIRFTCLAGHNVPIVACLPGFTTWPASRGSFLRVLS